MKQHGFVRKKMTLCKRLPHSFRVQQSWPRRQTAAGTRPMCERQRAHSLGASQMHCPTRGTMLDGPCDPRCHGLELASQSGSSDAPCSFMKKLVVASLEEKVDCQLQPHLMIMSRLPGLRTKLGCGEYSLCQYHLEAAYIMIEADAMSREVATSSGPQHSRVRFQCLL